MAQIMKLMGGMASMLFLSCSLYAADIPSTQENAAEYDWKMCVNRHANYCVTTVCLNSEDRHCPQNCQALAEEKCKEKLIQ